MSVLVAWTCTEIAASDTGDGRGAETRPLKTFRDVPAYVLLGDPGSGKTHAFEAECKALGSKACYVTARDFLELDPERHTEWHDKTLFIDGLDEVRAGSRDVRKPFDGIRRKLDALAKPRFRLSCREADWLGANDRTHLKTVSRDEHVTELRLEPLARQDIERILEAHPDVDDAGKFIAAAEENGVDGFLGNPQTLDLLARAVGGADGEGSWPESRLELFEAACRRMVEEQNQEHLAATRSSAGSSHPSVEDLLDAAGRLCATQLVAGVDGFALTGNAEDRNFPAFERCGESPDGTHGTRQPAGEDVRALRAALTTKLFTARSTDRFSSIHRHVAEFLGGRYLARLIEGDRHETRNTGGGLPVRRVIALLAGNDGMVVTELRGLSAWLAAHSRIARSHLIDRDPIGVGLYGDISQFSSKERVVLMDALQIQSSRLALAHRKAKAFLSLATHEMAEAINRILNDSSRIQERQTFVYFLVCVLARSSPLPELGGALLNVVRDETRLPDIKATALDAYVRHAADAPEQTDELEALLVDVHAGRISDPHDEVLGTLLTQLYPEQLQPAEVWTYLTESPNSPYGGRCFRFWRDLPDKSAPSAVAAHLDALAARRGTLWPALESHYSQGVPVRLLARGLETFGDKIGTKRLYDWLGVGLVSDLRRLPDDSLGRIRRWLAKRLAIQKEIFTEGLRRRTELDDVAFHRDLPEIKQRLYGADWAADLGPWFLEQAAAKGATDPRVAEYLLEQAVNAARTGSSGFSLDLLERRVKSHAVLAGIYTNFRRTDEPTDAAARRYLKRSQQYTAQEDQQHQAKIAYVRAHEDALRENRCRPDLLHQLAAAYFGLLTDAEGDTPVDRLRNLFRNDAALTEAALLGLSGAIHRDDLPALDEIIRLRGENREHYLALPVLASLEELNNPVPTSLNELAMTTSTELCRLDADRVRTALGFHYCTLGLSEPGWFASILDSLPELVADVLIRTAAMEIHSGREHVPGLYDLACDPRHADIARLTSLPLLRGFPVRCTVRQMTDLSHLLWSALQHAEQEELLNLVKRKLSRSSMDVAQRAHWLGAGLVLSPDAYLQPSKEFAAGSEQRVRHLFALFSDQPLRAFPMERLGPRVLQLIVSLAARTFRPWGENWAGGVMEITPDMSAAERVQWMIQSLAQLPTEQASVALDALASDEGLSPWRAELIRARDDQRVVRRDATRHHPDIERVCWALNDGPPANAADLAALVMDRLEEIAERIRNGNTDDWRPYWNENQHGRPSKPKPEESCRDALLRGLQQLLPAGVEAQREAYYANEKRADIRISGNGFNVPIEIKKNTHHDVWRALHEQLIGQYVRDPETDGYGIYLVLWFGETDGHRTPLPPSGVQPNRPDVIKSRLQALLTPEEARKIAIGIIDVSPHPAESRISQRDTPPSGPSSAQ